MYSRIIFKETSSKDVRPEESIAIKKICSRVTFFLIFIVNMKNFLFRKKEEKEKKEKKSRKCNVKRELKDFFKQKSSSVEII